MRSTGCGREVAAVKLLVLKTRKPMRRASSFKSSAMKMSGVVYALGIVLIVCSLVANLATRYNSTGHPQSYAQSSVHNDSSSGSHHERLTKDALSWTPVLLRSAMLERPTYSSRVVLLCPDLPASIFDEKLFNRPPPVA
jgi:hypothetical protein